MSNYQVNQDSNGGGMWLVRLPDGGVRAVTLEQLDDAYQRDWINGDTEVMEEGASRWQKLSDLIGEGVDELAAADDEDEATAAYAAVPTLVQAVPAAYRPSCEVPPATYATVPHARQAGYPMPSQAPQNAMGASLNCGPGARHDHGYGPAASPVQKRPAYQAAVERRAAAPEVKSVAPVASDIDDIDLDFGVPPFKRKGRRSLAFAAVGLLGIGGAIAAIANSESAAPPSVAVAGPARSAAPLPFKPTPLPELEAVERAPKPSTEGRLSDDMKKALTEADKQRSKSKKAKVPSSANTRTSASPRARSSERSVFSRGGDSHDPLNGSL